MSIHVWNRWLQSSGLRQYGFLDAASRATVKKQRQFVTIQMMDGILSDKTWWCRKVWSCGRLVCYAIVTHSHKIAPKKNATQVLLVVLLTNDNNNNRESTEIKNYFNAYSKQIVNSKCCRSVILLVFMIRLEGLECSVLSQQSCSVHRQASLFRLLQFPLTGILQAVFDLDPKLVLIVESCTQLLPVLLKHLENFFWWFNAFTPLQWNSATASFSVALAKSDRNSFVSLDSDSFRDAICFSRTEWSAIS